jgi:hypothetical protein
VKVPKGRRVLEGLRDSRAKPAIGGPRGPGAEMDVDLVKIYLSQYDYDPDHKVYGWDTGIYADELDLVLVFCYMDMYDGAYEWVALPFQRYFNTSSYFNHFTYAVESGSGGEVWVYIRNSNGSTPYSTMSGVLNFKIYVVEYDNLQTFNDLVDDPADMLQVEAYFENRKE